MKRQEMASAANIERRDEGGVVASIASHPRIAANRKAFASPPAGRKATLGPAGVNRRTHTLVLTGELDRSSAHTLEAAIERLCEEGVTGITLDLRELTYIDSIGVSVIAFRCNLCRKRGFDFALIPGSRLIHRAFEQAGVTELLPFEDQGVSTPRLPALTISHRSRDDCGP